MLSIIGQGVVWEAVVLVIDKISILRASSCRAPGDTVKT